jgi:hypothetical protein
VADRWPRDLWLDAIWEDEALKPVERAVAYVYARYAGKNDTAWCSWAEIMRRTGMRSKKTVGASLAALVKAGWLSEVERPRQHLSAVYRLTCPVDNSLSGSDSLPLSGSPAVPFLPPAVPFLPSSGSDLGTPDKGRKLREERSDARAPARDPSGAQNARCPVHLTAVNGSGICGACRSEQIGTAS